MSEFDEGIIILASFLHNRKQEQLLLLSDQCDYVQKADVTSVFAVQLHWSHIARYTSLLCTESLNADDFQVCLWYSFVSLSQDQTILKLLLYPVQCSYFFIFCLSGIYVQLTDANLAYVVFLSVTDVTACISKSSHFILKASIRFSPESAFIVSYSGNWFRCWSAEVFSF